MHACACVCALLLLGFLLVFERFLAPCLIELVNFSTQRQ